MTHSTVSTEQVHDQIVALAGNGVNIHASHTSKKKRCNAEKKRRQKLGLPSPVSQRDWRPRYRKND